MVIEMENLIIGSHVSFTKDKQLLGSVIEALSYNANTLMLYTGAPQNSNRLPISHNLTKEGLELMEKSNIDKNNVIVHAPYIINPSNSKNLEFNISFLRQEIDRVMSLGLSKLVLHPGSHVGAGIEEGIKNTIDVLNKSLRKEDNIIICIETMAGKGTEIGSNFEQINQIIEGVILKDKVGVCLDTCHINDAGYDLNNFDKVIDDFDKIIGLDKLICVHINDSKNQVGAHKDRHDNFGLGSIGFDNLLKVIYHDKLKDIPKILETPYVGDENTKDRLYPPYKFEIEMIRNKKFDSNLLENIREYYKNL